MSSQHTPAPWIVSTGMIVMTNNQERRESGVGQLMVAMANPIFGDETDDANARIIANAPSMFKALDDIISEAEEDGMPSNETLARGQLALSKARGETA